MIKTILNKISLIRQLYFKSINKNYYSQFGEDKVLNELISSDLIDGFYIDVGCFHHKKHSNTYLLHKKGWTGINIDMEEDKINLFNIARPKDYNYYGAISDKIENVKIFRNQKYGVSSTLDPYLLEKKDIIDEKFITANTLINVIESSPFRERKIDLLNVDAEGYDYKVIKSLNFEKYSPKFIIIETHLKSIEEIIKSETYNFILDKKYSLRSWCLFSLIFKRNY